MDFDQIQQDMNKIKDRKEVHIKQKVQLYRENYAGCKKTNIRRC